MSIETEVTLGRHTVMVSAQRHAYLTNSLAKYLTSIVESNTDITSAGDVLNILGDKVYDLLVVAVPTYGRVCPKHEFMGYGSDTAFQAKAYDEREDNSPTPPEVLDAFAVAAHVNRFDSLKIVGRFIDPNLLRTWLNTQVANAIMSASPSLRSVKDGSATSTTTSTTAPTLKVVGDSPSSESTSSSEATNVEGSSSSET